MDHQQYEEWIFADHELTQEQEDTLGLHLQDCQPCRELAAAWMDLDLELRDSPLLAPSPGFVRRWQIRRDAQRIRRENRLNRLALVGASLAAGFLFLLLVIQVIGSFSSPAQFIVVTLEPLMEATPKFFAMTDLAGAIFQVAPTASLLFLWILAVILTILSLIWIISIYQFTYKRRIIL